ncbi:hypothetical protein GCM10009798_06280 [Nocardioides panacihumi]|uniref:Uncharacterized protein n=2 Tax=Nocardioides panacihumi TaxID=400774 RepID=A0ABN2QCS4_9ACTN
MAFLSLGFDELNWGVIVATWLPWLPATWVFVIRPRLIMLDDELIVVGVFATKRYPLREVVRAEPDGYGTYFWLASGEMFCAATLWRPNYAAWFRWRTRAHKVATKILVRGAALRGDPQPSQVDQARGLGDMTIQWWFVS